MSTVYKSAVLTMLPNARLVLDPFHVHPAGQQDRRRRAPLGHLRPPRPPRPGQRPGVHHQEPPPPRQDRLSETARHKLLCALADLARRRPADRAAWRAKELLRDLVKLSPNHTGLAATRDQAAKALQEFFGLAATTGASVPEVQTLAETVSTWRAEIARAVLTGHSNAAAEGVNRLVKLVYRTAFGLTNVTNQQRRSRYAASRSTRPEWLHAVTTTTSQPRDSAKSVDR
jgi:transposase